MSDHDTYTYKWTRRQFPVRPAFTTTDNKLQSESFFRIVIWLYEPVFSYGQIKVANSRAVHPNNITKPILNYSTAGGVSLCNGGKALCS